MTRNHVRYYEPLDSIFIQWLRKEATIQDGLDFVDKYLRPFPYLVALVTALDLDLGSFLGRSKKTSIVDLANQIDVPEAHLQAIVSIMEVMELITIWDDGSLSLSDRGNLLFCEKESYSVIGSYVAMYKQVASNLEQFTVRLKNEENNNVLTWPPRDKMASRNFEVFMNSKSSLVAAWINNVIDFSQLTTLLDVGGGDGTIASLLCQAHLKLNATVFNLPVTMDIFNETVTAKGIKGRLSFQGGDFRIKKLPMGFDAVLFSRVLCDWDDPLVERLLGQCKDIIGVKGQVLIVDPYGFNIPKNMNKWDDDPWFFFWKTIVPGYYQRGTRSLTEWEALAEKANLEIENTWSCNWAPLKGYVLMKMKVQC